MGSICLGRMAMALQPAVVEQDKLEVIDPTLKQRLCNLWILEFCILRKI